MPFTVNAMATTISCIFYRYGYIPNKWRKTTLILREEDVKKFYINDYVNMFEKIVIHQLMYLTSLARRM